MDSDAAYDKMKQASISRFFKKVSTVNKEKVDQVKEVEKEAEVDEVLDLTLDSENDEEQQQETPVLEPIDGEEHPTVSKVPDLNDSRLLQKQKILNASKDITNSVDVSAFNEKLKDIMNKRKLGKIKGSLIDESDEIAEQSEADEHNIKKKRKKSDQLTPLDRQVKDLKLGNMDKVLVIRVGYKYKIFAQDAIIASTILHLQLIPGKVTIDDSNPNDSKYKQFAYCSFPDVRLKVHLERLVRSGLKVAVVEQSETATTKKFDNSKAKTSVFERKITGTYSKATYATNCEFEVNHENILGTNNSIWALDIEVSDSIYKYYLWSIQLSNGEVIYDSFEESKDNFSKVETRMKYLNPSEIVSPVVDSFPIKLKKRFLDLQLCQKNYDILAEDLNIPKKELLNNRLIELWHILYRYLKEYSNEKLLNIGSNYRHFSQKISIQLQAQTINNLDLISNDDSKGTLFWILDHTRTPFGKRLLKEWLLRPLLSKDAIVDRLNAIDCILESANSIFFESLNQMMKGIPDLLRTINRVSFGKTSQREVYFLLKQLTGVIKHFEAHKDYIEVEINSNSGAIKTKSTKLASIMTQMFEFSLSSVIPQLLLMINVSAVMEKDQKKQLLGFFNLNNYDNSENIIKMQRDIDSVKAQLHDELQNIKKILKRPHLAYKDEVDFLIEVRNTQVKGIPSDWVKVNNTKMISRFLTPRTKELVELLEYQNDLLYNEISKEYDQFLNRIASYYNEVKTFIMNLAEYDCLLSLAAVSCNVGYTRPVFTDSNEQLIIAKQARNPIIESLGVDYVPNDIEMEKDSGRVLVITGPNMGGKSSYIRQIALMVIMAQIGSYVPAESLKLSVFDNVLTRIGSQDNILQGQSTFKVELSETVEIINSCTSKTLLLLDEVGRGTSTRDGNAIAWALIKYFVEEEQCPFILFTTHFTIVTTVKSPLLKSYHMNYVQHKNENENWTTVIFLYQLKAGVTDSSYGLNVAKLAGIDTHIINRAHDVAISYKNDTEFDTNMILFQKVRNVLANRTTARETLKVLLELDV